jgi:phenylacetate-CoA ligase
MKVDVAVEAKKLLEAFDTTQYNYSPNVEKLQHLPIITRDDIRKTKMQSLFYQTRSSGSTGEPVTVEKTINDYIWYVATNLRELKWRKWDLSKTLAIIKPNIFEEKKSETWGFPLSLARNQGKCYHFPYKTLDEIQTWLEKKNPHYIHCTPSILKQLDLTRLTNLIDTKGTGENGAAAYSSEECGNIAIQCPSNKQNYHVMENQVIETTDNDEVVITTMTNPYIKRYKNGDVVLLGSCTCGRSLQTITKIYGRVRNFFVMPNGQKKWPLLGSLTFNEKYGIKQFKAIQKKLDFLELQIVSPPLTEEKENELKLEVQKMLQTSIHVQVKHQQSFTNYKHEEFVCEIQS